MTELMSKEIAGGRISAATTGFMLTGCSSVKSGEYIQINSRSVFDSSGYCISERFSRMRLESILTDAIAQNGGGNDKKLLLDLKAQLSEGCYQVPYIEVLLHEAIPSPYVASVHHPLADGFICGKNGESCFNELENDGIWLDSELQDGQAVADVKKKLSDFESRTGRQAAYVMVPNCGIFCTGENEAALEQTVKDLEQKLWAYVKGEPDFSPVPVDIEQAALLAPAVRCLFSGEKLGCVVFCSNAAVNELVKSANAFSKIPTDFTPNHLLFSTKETLFVDDPAEFDSLLPKLTAKLEFYCVGDRPRMIGFKNLGFYAYGETKAECDMVRNAFLHSIAVAYYAEFFGGGRPSNREKGHIDAVKDCFPVRKHESAKQISGKIAIITGGAQGFGMGIAEGLAANGAYVVIADINAVGARELAEKINSDYGAGRAMGLEANVSEEENIKSMVYATSLAYGGLDIFISNVGVLKAGGLEDINLKTFEMMTKINYTAYFLCAKYASRIMKIQNEYRKELFMDIIQINSKSGLSGSSLNFAYSGSKFGGIGLTESFALELVDFHIKVNSICPGNYFDGPLWCAPKTGLFAQYLHSGKVPGAKDIDDVKRFYESKIPMKRGCGVKDVVRAVYYVIEQEYETGQVLPVTGGQEMLN